jgi:hypothetical protein
VDSSPRNHHHDLRAVGDGPRLVVIGEALSLAHRRRGGSDGPTIVDPPRSSSLLGEDELRSIEDTYAAGITAAQIVDVFAQRNIKLSEASFRKYIQLGLLPRSRRVGRKGKHRGSLGVYPAKTVRRINAVKQLMADGHTIEEIAGQFLVYTDLIENLGEAVAALFARLDADVASPRVDDADKKPLTKDIAELRRVADDLTRRLDDVSRRIAAPRADKARRSGAAGSAEDLL